MIAATEAEIIFAHLHFMAVEGNEWQQWKARIWNQIAKMVKGYPGLAPLEQWMRRSQAEKRCVDCGSPGIVQHEGKPLIPAVSHYYHCQECDDYWQAKA